MRLNLHRSTLDTGHSHQPLWFRRSSMPECIWDTSLGSGTLRTRTLSKGSCFDLRLRPFRPPCAFRSHILLCY